MTDRLTVREWLDAPATQALITVLDRAGIDFRFVGGVVRDSLLGRPIADIDIATPAPPDAVIAAAHVAGIAAIPTGLAHGTVTLLAAGRPFEVTTLRRDVETDGRHAVVAFTDDWGEDAARRDFTMNALYADRNGTVTDFFGGIADARAGRVRFIGDPAARIAEDALRILRFFRFHAWYGHGDPDRAGLTATAGAASMLRRLSGERVRDEILKLLRAPDPMPVWRAMIAAGIIAHAVPEAIHVGAADKVIAAEATLGLPGDALRRLGALIGPLDAERVSKLSGRMRLSNRDALRLAAVAAGDAEVQSLSQADFARALYRADPEILRDVALVAGARTGRPDLATVAALIRFSEGWRRPRLPVGGDDAQALGVTPGPGLGALLAAVEAWWIDRDFRPDRPACLGELARLAAAA